MTTSRATTAIRDTSIKGPIQISNQSISGSALNMSFRSFISSRCFAESQAYLSGLRDRRQLQSTGGNSRIQPVRSSPRHVNLQSPRKMLCASRNAPTTASANFSRTSTSCLLNIVRHLFDKAPRALVFAHIISDSSPRGEPIVPNGISLCKIHHATFDRNLIGIRSDYRIVVNSNLLNEVDGPMLKHGIQEMHGAAIHLPRSEKLKPDRERLDVVFVNFLNGLAPRCADADFPSERPSTVSKLRSEDWPCSSH